MSSSSKKIDVDTLILKKIKKSENKKLINLPKYALVVLGGLAVIGFLFYKKYKNNTPKYNCKLQSYALSAFGESTICFAGEKDLDNPYNEPGVKEIIVAPVLPEQDTNLAVVGQERMAAKDLDINLDPSKNTKFLCVTNRNETDEDVTWDSQPDKEPIRFTFDCNEPSSKRYFTCGVPFDAFLLTNYTYTHKDFITQYKPVFRNFRTNNITVKIKNYIPSTFKLYDETNNKISNNNGGEDIEPEFEPFKTFEYTVKQHKLYFFKDNNSDAVFPCRFHASTENEYDYFMLPYHLDAVVLNQQVFAGMITTKPQKKNFCVDSSLTENNIVVDCPVFEMNKTDVPNGQCTPSRLNNAHCFNYSVTFAQPTIAKTHHKLGFYTTNEIPKVTQSVFIKNYNEWTTNVYDGLKRCPVGFSPSHKKYNCQFSLHANRFFEGEVGSNIKQQKSYNCYPGKDNFVINTAVPPFGNGLMASTISFVSAKTYTNFEGDNENGKVDQQLITNEKFVEENCTWENHTPGGRKQGKSHPVKYSACRCKYCLLVPSRLVHSTLSYDVSAQNGSKIKAEFLHVRSNQIHPLNKASTAVPYIVYTKLAPNGVTSTLQKGEFYLVAFIQNEWRWLV